MFNIIGAIISGLIIGALARLFYPGVIDMGLGMTALLGVGGSLLAGLVASRGNVGDGFNRAGCISSIIGAMVLLFIGRHMGWHF
ncbi:MAG: GlsB/YeaQ/YmgE family stress response membrane protein [Sphingomonadales bacterium]|nr:GlsB/YeaQ/YmgE family stress response membrane protein [Sphingomonadales bacterium]